jgi:pimeloyl-ACP methyl ester carboxylesterase
MRRAWHKALVVGLAVLALMGATAITGRAATSSGFNDWRCVPSARHPRPVVLLHGLGGNGDGNWSYIGPQLAGAGYCAFALTYGNPGGNGSFNGTAPVAESAAEIGRFIDRVLVTTGAAKVDIVGHSEGGFQSLYVTKITGYAPKVAHVVAIAPPTHGTTFLGLVRVGDLLAGRDLMNAMLRRYGCYACADLIVRGPAVRELTRGPIAMPGVHYTVIATRFDLLVTPHETSFIREPGVRNLFVQDRCPLDPVGHVGLAFDRGVFDMVLGGLNPAAPPKVRCTLGPPV